MNEWLRLALVTAPASTAVSLVEAKRQLRITHSDDDAYITTLISAATAFVEGPHGAGICLTPQTWRLSLDYFPCEIVIPLGPVTAITKITYTDADNDTVIYYTTNILEVGAVSSIRADYDSQPCRLWPARDHAWPAVNVEPGGVKVTFSVGYATTPADLKHALLLLINHFYEHREAALDTGAKFGLLELPFGVETILNRYRPGRVA